MLSINRNINFITYSFWIFIYSSLIYIFNGNDFAIYGVYFCYNTICYKYKCNKTYST